MNNIFRRVSYSIIVVIVICSFSISTFATSKQDLQNKQTDLQSKINETSSEINGVQSEITDAMKELNSLTSKITDSENKITELGNQITNLTTEIGNKSKIIEEQEVKYQEQKRLLDKRLVAVYQSGNTTFLDVLLSASSLTDFISKYYFVERIAEYDNELLTKIQSLKNDIEIEKKELETNKVAVETAKEEEVGEQASLENLKSQKEVLVSNLSDEEKNLQEQLDEYEEDKKMVDEEIAKAIAIEEANRKAKEEEERKAKEQSNNSSPENKTNNEENDVSNSNTESTPNDNNSKTENTVSSSGFICPLAGRNKGDITTGYYGYSGHTGVDFARNSKGAVNGLPVLAAKSGTVITSKALKKSNGEYRSYGEYIVINHGDGTLSLYAHMQAGSRLVSEGTKVSQGQQIGSVGSTGNSTGPHLHFEIKIVSGKSIKTVNPVSYLP